MRNELSATSGAHLPPRVTVEACPDCNRSLGKQFEEPASTILKPLMRGERRALTAADMAVVAAWCWLKDIEYVLARPDIWSAAERTAQPHTPEQLALWRGHLADLRASGRPPVGEYLVRLGVVGWPASPTDPADGPFLPTGWSGAFTYLSSFNQIGLLVVESSHGSSQSLEAFAAASGSDPRATRVWPDAGLQVAVPGQFVRPDQVQQWWAEWNFDPGVVLGGGWQIKLHRRR